MTASSFCRSNVALVVLVILASINLYVLYSWQMLRDYVVPDMVLSVIEPVTDSAPVVPLAASAVPALQELAMTRNRPLFTPARKPYVPPPALEPTLPTRNQAVAKTQPKTPPVRRYDFKLSAIWIVDEVPVVLMRNPRTGADERLKEGEEILGWKVLEITDAAVTFVNGDEKEVVELRQFSGDGVRQPVAVPPRPVRNTAAAQPRAAPQRVRRPRRALQGPRRTNLNRQLQQTQ